MLSSSPFVTVRHRRRYRWSIETSFALLLAVRQFRFVKLFHLLWNAKLWSRVVVVVVILVVVFSSPRPSSSSSSVKVPIISIVSIPLSPSVIALLFIVATIVPIVAVAVVLVAETTPTTVGRRRRRRSRSSVPVVVVLLFFLLSTTSMMMMMMVTRMVVLLITSMISFQPAANSRLLHLLLVAAKLAVVEQIGRLICLRRHFKQTHTKTTYNVYAPR